MSVLHSALVLYVPCYEGMGEGHKRPLYIVEGNLILMKDNNEGGKSTCVGSLNIATKMKRALDGYEIFRA